MYGFWISNSEYVLSEIGPDRYPVILKPLGIASSVVGSVWRTLLIEVEGIQILFNDPDPTSVYSNWGMAVQFQTNSISSDRANEIMQAICENIEFETGKKPSFTRQSENQVKNQIELKRPKDNEKDRKIRWTENLESCQQRIAESQQRIEATKKSRAAQIQSEREQCAKRKEQIEQNRLDQQWLAEQRKRQQQDLSLKLQRKHMEKLEQELVNVHVMPLLSLREAVIQFRGLKAFYPPSKSADTLFKQKLAILIIRCNRQINNSYKKTDKQAWIDIISELTKMKNDMM